MKEKLSSFQLRITLPHHLINALDRAKNLFRTPPTPSFPASPDPSSAEYLANIYMAPGELSEDSLLEPKRSRLIEFAKTHGKDIIHLPSKPEGRVLIGVGLTAMAIMGAIKIYEHRKKD